MTIEDEWKTFRERVMAPDCHEVQVREMRIAFFGGASSMFNIAALEIGRMEEEAVVEALKKLSEELKNFVTTL